MRFDRAMLALLGPKNDGLNARRSQNLNYFFAAALRQVIRKETPITDDDTECRFFAHWMITTPSPGASCRECTRQKLAQGVRGRVPRLAGNFTSLRKALQMTFNSGSAELKTLGMPK